MAADAESIRREASVLARRRRPVVSSSVGSHPRDWRPRTIINPEDGQPFTDAAAWELIACLLDGNEPLEILNWIILRERLATSWPLVLLGGTSTSSFNSALERYLAGAFTIARNSDLTELSSFGVRAFSMKSEAAKFLIPDHEAAFHSCPSCGHDVVRQRRLSTSFLIVRATSDLELCEHPLRRCLECGIEFLDSEAEVIQHERRVSPPGSDDARQGPSIAAEVWSERRVVSSPEFHDSERPRLADGSVAN